MAAAVAGLFAGGAFAQSSVTVYGVVDAGVEFANHRVFVKAGWDGGQSSPASIMRMSVEMSAP